MYDRLQEETDRATLAREPASICRTLAAIQEDRLWAYAPREAETSARIAEALGRPPGPGNVYWPINVRDLTATSGAGGGYLQNSQTAPGGTIVAALRANSITDRLGVQRIPVNGGSATFPRLTAATTSTWLANEASVITEAQPTFGQITAAPKNCAAYFEVSRQLLKQTTRGADAFIENEIGRAVAAATDLALVAGTGASGQPTGILNTSGIGTAAGTSLTYINCLTAIETVETANALVTPERGAWAIAPGAAKVLRGRERAAGSGYILENGRISDYQAISTNSLAAGFALFGDWSGVALATWGVLEIGTDPFGANSALFKTGIVGIRAIMSMDVIVLRPASFYSFTAIT